MCWTQSWELLVTLTEHFQRPGDREETILWWRRSEWSPGGGACESSGVSKGVRLSEGRDDISSVCLNRITANLIWKHF